MSQASSVNSAAVVGWAWRTPLGRDIETVVQKILAGDRAAVPFDRGYAVRHIARIPDEPAPSRHNRYLRRMGLFGTEVAAEAMAHAGLVGHDRVGLFAAVGGLRAHWGDMMAALANQTDDATGSWARGLSGIHPHWLLRHLSNNAHALLAKDLGTRGEGATFGGANAGAQALSAAIRALAAGVVDAAIVVAYDTLLEPETLVEIAARGLAATGVLGAPYDEIGAGLVPGEAAAAVALVPVGARQALGHVGAADAASGEVGEPGEAPIAAVVRRLGCGAGVIDGAARSRRDLEAAERAAFGSWDSQIPLIATASSLGSIGAATAVVQLIALARFLTLGQLPPIAGLGLGATGPLNPLTAGRTTGAKVGLGIGSGAPGLVGAVRVEVA